MMMGTPPHNRSLDVLMTTIYICDRCRFASTNKLARDGYGEIQIAGFLTGHHGAPTPAGTQDWWLCGNCLHALESFLDAPRTAAQQPEDSSPPRAPSPPALDDS